MRLLLYLELTTASFVWARTLIASLPICLFSAKKKEEEFSYLSQLYQCWKSLRSCWREYTGEHKNNDHRGSSFVGNSTENNLGISEYCSEYQRYSVCFKTLDQTSSRKRRQIWWFISWFSMLCAQQHMSNMFLKLCFCPFILMSPHNYWPSAD